MELLYCWVHALSMASAMLPRGIRWDRLYAVTAVPIESTVTASVCINHFPLSSILNNCFSLRPGQSIHTEGCSSVYLKSAFAFIVLFLSLCLCGWRVYVQTYTLQHIWGRKDNICCQSWPSTVLERDLFSGGVCVCVPIHLTHQLLNASLYHAWL